MIFLKAAFPCMRIIYPTDFVRTTFVRVTKSDQTLFNVCFHMYGFQYGKINVQTKSACRSDFPQVNCVNSHDFTRGIIIKKVRFKTETYEKLIGLVREEPALYDASLSGYKDHTLQKHIWKNIATEMSFKTVTCKYTF